MGGTGRARDVDGRARRLTPMQRRVRAALTAVVLAGLLAGTFFGDDEHFPFGPFRMYSTRNDPNGNINVVKLWIRRDGRAGEYVPTHSTNLRPAEVNGQVTRYADDSELARHLARSYERVTGGRVEELRVIRGIYRFRGGRPVAYREITLGSWSAR